ncbi:MAG: thiamine ABC transporter substrate-binding protein [Moraxellaceae bacterium]|nr:thiamine ABC transporter substrate-binding protein [Pseudobdellovibrionaceae bacterium]
MRQFILYMTGIFSILFLLYVYREDSQQLNDQSSIKIYASGSFISSWGPGPELKTLFEKQTGLKVSFIEMSDPGITLQKVSFSAEDATGDIVLGLDQFDIARFTEKVRWKDISHLNTISQSIFISSGLNLNELKNSDQFMKFIPYDWSAISFVKRSDSNYQINSLPDLLQPNLKSKIAFEDPRTSSPGLQFLLWVASTQNEDQAIQFLKDLNAHAHSFSPSWSTAYGLFKNKNADVVLSYITSPIYHLVEENDSNYQALEFSEGLPVQVEFMGLLASCKNCEAAQKFISFVQSKDGQRIIMNKNYMLPMDKQITEGTAFDTLRVFKLLDFKVYSKEEINKWLRIWSDIRKNDG